MDAAVAELKKIRDDFALQINRAEALVQVPAIKEWDLAVLSMKRMVLDKAWQRYQEAHVELISHPLVNDELSAEFDKDAVAIARLYSKPRALLDTHADALKVGAHRPPAKASEISVPKFNGDYRNWITWRAQFVAKVMSVELSAGDKVDLLLDALTGEARQCAGDPERRDLEDLQRMWAKLETTYDNKYQIIVGHISAILDLPRIVESSPKMMRNMIDVCDQEMRALQRFDYNTDEWSPVIAVILLRKLDQSTLAVWEMDRVPAEPPALKELFPFLEKRILALRNLKLATMQVDNHARERPGARHEERTSYTHRHESSRRTEAAGNSSNQHKRSRSEARAGHQQREGPPPPVCFVCNFGNHFPWFCKKFQNMTMEQRIAEVTKKRQCPCCLVAKHLSDQCTNAGCQLCDNAKHNRILCPKAQAIRPRVDRRLDGHHNQPRRA